MKKKYVKLIFFFTVVFMLLGFLYIFIVSYEFDVTSKVLFLSQLKNIAIGFLVFLLSFFIPESFLKKYNFILFFINIFMLILVFVPGIGIMVNGARRWVNIGGFGFQPVEFLKPSLILFLATLFSSLDQKKAVFYSLFSLLVISFILLLQPDFGSLIIIFIIFIGMFFISGVKFKFILQFISLLFLLSIIVILLSPYKLKRVKTFLHIEKDEYGSSYQVDRMLTALGSGGWFGSNTQIYIPEITTDGIFAGIGQRFGFFGTSFLIVLFMFYFYLIYKIAMSKPINSFDNLVCFGILFWLSSQIFINISAATSLIPLTGLPLPFFSYGGTSLVSLLFIIGILLRIAIDEKN